MSKKRTEIRAALIVLAIGVILVAIVGLWVPMRDVMPNAAPSILLFNGRGTSPNDVAALDRILTDGRFSYSTASSQQLDDLNESELAAYRLLIVPGGNFEEIGNGLDASTTARLRTAIRGGLNYLGICAGAFFAGHSPYNGLNLTSGVRFPFYAAEDRGIRKTAVAITTPGGLTLDHYWEDGPQLGGWGDVVAKYPRNACRGRRHLRRWIGDSHRDSSRGTGELAPRHDVHDAGQRQPGLRSDADRRRIESAPPAALLTKGARHGAMLFRHDILQGIAEGRVTLAFRRWRRAPPRDGSSLRTPIGVLCLDRVTVVDEGDITPEDVRRTGMTREELRASIAGEGTLVRIELRLAGDDPRIALRERLPDRAEFDEVAATLARIDAASARPWTVRYLQLIADQPGVVSRVLARQAGADVPPFKRRVRQLKELGLTESLEVGYRLSPRGRAFLESLVGDARWTDQPRRQT